jgi:membrane-associated protein
VCFVDHKNKNGEAMPLIGDFIEAILEFVKTQYFVYGYFIVLIGSFIENVMPVGFVFPGSTIVLLGGVYAGFAGGPNIFLIILLGCTGMFLGSCSDYLMGRLGVIKFAKRNKFLAPHVAKLDPHLEKARLFLNRKGGIAIVIAHFVSSMRSVVAFTAGGVNMQFYKFATFSFAAALFWTTCFAGGGFFVGEAFEGVEAYMPFVGIGLTVVILGVYFVVHKFSSKKVEKLERELEVELEQEREIEKVA